jgi:hypothetical protein
MKQQTFQNHKKMAPKAYYIGLALGLMVLLFTIIHAQDMSKIIPGYWLPILLVFISISIILVGYFARAFALKAQDRAIRAEENLRHFAITGKLLDKRLTISQIIALRFASDEEFVLLAQQAADENLSNKQIKEQIKNWRADDYRI